VQNKLLREFEDFARSAANVTKLMEKISQRLHEEMARYNWVGFYLADESLPGTLVLGPYEGSFLPLQRVSFDVGLCGHAATTRMNHFRADYSSYHLVDYNPSTGAVIKKQTNQGLADESAWARGQAWAIYSFTTAYAETGRSDFLVTAKRVANYWLAHARAKEGGDTCTQSWSRSR
jgi:hypothetical protein